MPTPNTRTQDYSNLEVKAAALNLPGLPEQVLFTITAGTANICNIAGRVVDAEGVNITTPVNLIVYLSTSATGRNVSATAYSTGAALTVGTTVATITANKVFNVTTHTDGTFSVAITATAKPQNEYLAAVLPMTGRVFLSAATVTASYG